ncbi:amino acid permease [Sporomusa acidovorans]|uniref:Aromatic amino acid transport protein AroP n=1 Tax=Sporomusa acidovorans (strain ATCC 49682 / DSM 3132 / Mol) TaxID=1123286 RepID=A0ABZ3JBB8_SPOA4|nr:amino acid permease [Sporomusa acidovorans]OZC13332.1 aromatic amino acid transport protein AroP [Sporomusa acidovorans DSM 3132]SDD96233.1 amino acid/polyamine/organocation transporter, APC superfamily [Sporomusa acidovorans]
MNTRNPDQHIQRGLKNRHIQMIALGGAIGTGLFYGSASVVKMAGPAITLSYLIGGIVIFFIMRALGEMAVAHPVSGSFSQYAYQYWGDLPGFIAGWNYWFNYVVVGMAELSVIGTYINYWLPDIPTWVSALVCLIVVTLINVINVKAYGEFEFWFAIIKVLAIIGMILFGIAMIVFGVGNGGQPVGISNLWTHGGFFPVGLHGVVLSLVLVMFSFGGVELVGITAGEAEEPNKSIPQAINQVVWRILLFYVGAMTVILSIFPWDEIGTAGSPFVQIFSYVGIPAAANLLNFVVLTAALSAYNSALYSNGRMLYGLAKQGNAPKFLGKLNGAGAPVNAVLVSTVITLLTVLISYLDPEKVFLYFMALATISIVINWATILIVQLKFRQYQERVKEPVLFKMPLYPLASYLSLAFLVLVVIIMAFMPDMRYSLYVAPVWLLILYIGYKIKH